MCGACVSECANACTPVCMGLWKPEVDLECSVSIPTALYLTLWQGLLVNPGLASVSLSSQVAIDSPPQLSVCWDCTQAAKSI